jgi:hypothetical protein
MRAAVAAALALLALPGTAAAAPALVPVGTFSQPGTPGGSSRLAPTKQGLRRMRRAVARSERSRLRITVRIRARDAAGNLSVKRVRRTVR